ncbi:helix-turn-helix domain-containing protein [Paenisporosarcina quisquiliarum]|uniref:helix-turn-helix domain-containing protein n=1 Tax=Paenisporosarcina quisquiliarum TaxID=365346 RepID=UPI0037355A26
MDNLIKLVGINIREIRKINNLTQEELAEKSGLQTSFLAGIERGDRNITLQTLEKVINGLEEDPKSIFNFNLNIDEDYIYKKQAISMLVNLLTDKTEKDIKLIHKIAKEILETYKNP